MRKVKLIGFFLGVILCFSVYAQEEEWGIVSQVFYNRYYDRTVDLDFQIYDPASIAMGGSYVSIANGPHAILQNPAGLTQISKIQASFVSGFNFDGRVYEEAVNSGRKVLSSPKPLFAWPGAGIVIPLKMGSRRLSTGLMYHKVLNPVSKFTETEYFYGGGRVNEIQDYSGGVATISGALAVEIIPKIISVGLTYNSLVGNNEYRLKIQSPYVDQQEYFNFKDEEETSGGFLNLGLMLKPIKWISLAATVTPPWTYSSKELFERFEITEFTTDVGYVTHVFETTSDSLSEFKIDVPLSYEIGIALFPVSRLTLACAYEVKDWAQAELMVNDIPITNSLESVKSLRVGLEYRPQAGMIEVPLRIGYYNMDFPQRDQFFEGNYYGEQIKRSFLTMGLGIYKGHFKVDFSYQFGESEVGWWMRAQDYYNERMFHTNDKFNRVLLAVTYQL